MTKTLEQLTKEQVEQLALQYFATCKEKNKMPNRAGFCVVLNWDRDRYFKEREEGEYTEILSRFEQVCEDMWIQRLGTNSANGATFYLKNAFKRDWSDESTIKLTLPTPILGNLEPQKDTIAVGTKVNVLIDNKQDDEEEI